MWANTLQTAHAWLKTYPTLVALETAVIQAVSAVVFTILYWRCTVWQATYWPIARWIFLPFVITLSLGELVVILATTSKASLQKCHFYDPQTDDDYIEYAGRISAWLNGERGLQLDAVGVTTSLTLIVTRHLLLKVRQVARLLGHVLVHLWPDSLRIRHLTVDLHCPLNHFDSLAGCCNQTVERTSSAILKRISNTLRRIRSRNRLLLQNAVLVVTTHVHATITEAELLGMTRWNDSRQHWQIAYEAKLAKDLRARDGPPRRCQGINEGAGHR